MTELTTSTPREELLQELFADPSGFDLAEAVTLIERTTPDAMPIGYAGPAAQEAVRLRPELSLAFPTADLAGARLVRDHDGVERLELTATCLGLYGVSSPLPSYLTESLLHEDERGTVRDFLDLFHHRLLSLLVRAAGKYRLDGDDLPVIAALLGLDDTPPAGISARQWQAGLGLIAAQPASAAGLENALSQWFTDAHGHTLPVQVEACALAWTALSASERALLGSANCGLGGDCTLGAAVLNRTTTVALTIGPVDRATWRSFLPDGDARPALAAIVARFNPQQLDIRVSVTAAADALPVAALGATEPDAALGRGGRLDGRAPDAYRLDFLLTA